MLRIDSNNIIQLASSNCLKKLQRSQESTEGKKITDLVTDTHKRPLAAAISQIRSENATIETSYECPLIINNAITPAEFEFAAIGGNPEILYGTIELAAQTHCQQQVIDKDHPLDHLTNIVDDPAIAFKISNGDVQVRSANTAFVRTFGHSPRALANDVRNFIFAGDFEYMDPYDSSQQSRHEVEMQQTVNGVQEFLHYEISCRADGAQYGIAIYTDVFTEYQPKEQLQVLHRIFRHNLRNELTVILGMAEEVQQRVNDSTVKRAAKSIIKRAEHLESVSEKVLVAQNILDKRTHDTTVEVGEVVQEAIAAAQEQWPSVAIIGEVEFPLPVDTSPRISEAIYGLIENSISHNTENPKVEVCATRRAPVHTSTRATGDWASITVRDNGPGVPDDIRNIVFDGHEITKLKHGEGLGLWLVRWVVDIADGDIVYRRPGNWTEIQLQLPLS